VVARNGTADQRSTVVEKCPECVKASVPRKEPLLITRLPEYPWQKIAIDQFILQGVNYLLVVDYFSRFPEVITLTETSSSKVISSLKSMFSRYGVPETLLSDNGPQFASHEFDEFANAYEFTHITSSPHYPQSNGLAEQTVKTVKKLLKLAEDLHVYGIT
jgi:transposase InsO family protein